MSAAGIPSRSHACVEARADPRTLRERVYGSLRCDRNRLGTGGNGTSGRALNNPLARLLRLADLYANGVLLASSGQSPVNPLSRPECRAAAGNEHPDRPDGVSLRGEVLGLTGVLARLSAKDEAELMSPLYRKRNVRVLVARDPSFSSFDPVAAALDALADVTVRDALPKDGELSGFAGMVVLSRSTSAAGFTAPEIAKSAGDGISVLWLTGRVDGASGGVSAALLPMLWPTPLSQLAAFVQRLDVACSQKATAA